MDGDEIHEVAVGPVHAGIIEPGHFRFQCHGEYVFHLEISLGYQHRGVERALIGGPDKRTIPYMETLAGDTTIGHALAYCEAVESLAACKVPARAQVLRAIALELERLANHTGDLGTLANDIGYLPTASYCGRIRGDFLNLTALICGNRFGRGLLRPGGVLFDLDEARQKQLEERLTQARKDVTSAVELLWNSSSVRARFENAGPVSRETALELGLVGLAARASGIEHDVRIQFPSGIYRFAQIPDVVVSHRQRFRAGLCPLDGNPAFHRLYFRPAQRTAVRPGARGSRRARAQPRRRVAHRRLARRNLPHGADRCGGEICALQNRGSVVPQLDGTGAWRCATSRFPISRCATKASTCPIAAMTCEVTSC